MTYLVQGGVQKQKPGAVPRPLPRKRLLGVDQDKHEAGLTFLGLYGPCIAQAIERTLCRCGTAFIDAQDVEQAFLLKLCRTDYRLLGACKHPDRAEAFLFRSAVRFTVDYLRHEAPRAGREASSEASEPAANPETHSRRTQTTA